MRLEPVIAERPGRSHFEPFRPQGDCLIDRTLAAVNSFIRRLNNCAITQFLFISTSARFGAVGGAAACESGERDGRKVRSNARAGSRARAEHGVLRREVYGEPDNRRGACAVLAAHAPQVTRKASAYFFSG